MKKLGTDSAYRSECGLYLCQGGKLYEEAIKAGADVRELMYCDDKPELPSGVASYAAVREILAYVSPMSSAPELVFSCAIPKNGAVPDKGRIIILENMQDPGNVGTIMRTAAAFGFHGLILAGSCADAYNAKTVRASMGAVFKTNIHRCGIEELDRLGLPIYAAALSKNTADLKDICFPADFALPSATRGMG
jgi:TrmH family RNA methyltransferase